MFLRIFPQKCFIPEWQSKRHQVLHWLWRVANVKFYITIQTFVKIFDDCKNNTVLLLFSVLYWNISWTCTNTVKTLSPLLSSI